MKKLLVLVTVLVGLVGVANVTKAATWKDDNLKPITSGGCTLVDKKSEANKTQVYTLNPDNTVKLGILYLNYWNRDARCDELQFHVDHNTSQARLRQWLMNTVIGWFKNVKTSPLEGKTVSTAKDEWFLIRNGSAQRIPDQPTAFAWGLLIGDRFPIQLDLTNDFYKYVKIGAPLNYNTGAYQQIITSIWRNGSQDYSSLPPRMVEEIKTFGQFKSCVMYYQDVYNMSEWDDAYRAFLDWRWKRFNSGCPLAQ